MGSFMDLIDTQAMSPETTEKSEKEHGRTTTLFEKYGLDTSKDQEQTIPAT